MKKYMSRENSERMGQTGQAIFDMRAICEMQDKAIQCNTAAQPSPLTTVRRRPTKDASITFRAPSALGSALREIAQRADRSLGYVCVTALTAYVAANQEAGHAL